MKSRFFLYGILLFALIGAADAGYLSSVALSGDALTCNFLKGCEVVARSPYSRVLGVPLSVFGFFFYLVSGGLAGWLLRTPSRSAAILLMGVSSLGVLASLYFMYLQGFVIRAWCEYCILSAITSLLVFLSAAAYFMKERAAEGNNDAKA